MNLDYYRQALRLTIHEEVKMRHESAKWRLIKRDMKPERDSFRESFPKCMACQCDNATDIHEMARGADRQIAYQHRCTWLHLCRQCHVLIGDQGTMPVSAQLAIKLVNDPDHFNKDKVCEIRGRAPTDVDWADLAQYLNFTHPDWSY